VIQEVGYECNGLRACMHSGCNMLIILSYVLGQIDPQVVNLVAVGILHHLYTFLKIAKCTCTGVGAVTV
jgi:hypothetical protein